jgi:hypothetical protein
MNIYVEQGLTNYDFRMKKQNTLNLFFYLMNINVEQGLTNYDFRIKKTLNLMPLQSKTIPFN